MNSKYSGTREGTFDMVSSRPSDTRSKPVKVKEVSTRFSRVHKGRMAPKGFQWLEIKTSSHKGAVVVPANLTHDQKEQLIEEVIKRLNNGSIKTS